MKVYELQIAKVLSRFACSSFLFLFFLFPSLFTFYLFRLPILAVSTLCFFPFFPRFCYLSLHPLRYSFLSISPFFPSIFRRSFPPFLFFHYAEPSRRVVSPRLNSQPGRRRFAFNFPAFNTAAVAAFQRLDVAVVAAAALQTCL